jgi:short chain dehydrogenase
VFVRGSSGKLASARIYDDVEPTARRHALAPLTGASTGAFAGATGGQEWDAAIGRPGARLDQRATRRGDDAPDGDPGQAAARPTNRFTNGKPLSVRRKDDHHDHSGPDSARTAAARTNVVLIGGSAGIGLETARRARAEGADAILVARDPNRLERAAREVDARSTAAFDATDPAALARFFDGLPEAIDHVLVTGPVQATCRCSKWTAIRCATSSRATWC